MDLTKSEQSAIRTILHDYLRLWMEGQSAACADLYAIDGDALGVDGTLLKGRTAIKEYYDMVMTGKYSGLSVRNVETTSVRELAPGVASMDAESSITNAQGPYPCSFHIRILVATHVSHSDGPK